MVVERLKFEVWPVAKIRPFFFPSASGTARDFLARVLAAVAEARHAPHEA